MCLTERTQRARSNGVPYISRLGLSLKLKASRYHYWRSSRSYWTRTAFPLDLPSVNNITNTPTVIGKRGKFAAVDSTLLAILPSNAPNSTALTILSSTAQAHFRDWEVLWEVESGCRWEPLFDRYRLMNGDGVLSLFLINGSDTVVTDLHLELL
jgi:hypothetical protein